MNQQLLSVRRAAAEANVSPHTIKAWIEQGEIIPIKEGMRYKIRRSELEAVAGPTDTTRIQRLQEEVTFLLRSYAELYEHVRRLEATVRLRSDGEPLSPLPALPHVLLPSLPLPRSKREIARFLANHGIKEDTAMRWFRADPPLPMDPAAALRYAVEHCHSVGYRGRSNRVHACQERLCLCTMVLPPSEHAAQEVLDSLHA